MALQRTRGSQESVGLVPDDSFFGNAEAGLRPWAEELVRGPSEAASLGALCLCAKLRSDGGAPFAAAAAAAAAAGICLCVSQ